MMRKILKIALCYSALRDNYTNALINAGRDAGLEVQTTWFGCAKKKPGMADFADFRVDDFDGLLLPGGGDIDPAFYGQTNQGSVNPDPDTDRCQFAMIDAFVNAGKPILGICKGQQLMNVYFGGTLCQDIPEKKAHMRLDENTDNRHIIEAREGSALYELYGKTFAVNSSHHQAVDRPGNGMIVTAWAQDEVIEALEHETLPVFTVQFHPERMDYQHRRKDTVAGGLIFQQFLKMVEQQRTQ